jgi:hypothetical protein
MHSRPEVIRRDRQCASALGAFSLDVVRFECRAAIERGAYRRDGLMARFGPDAALPDVLMAPGRPLTSIGGRAGARFAR